MGCGGGGGVGWLEREDLNSASDPVLSSGHLLPVGDNNRKWSTRLPSGTPLLACGVVSQQHGKCQAAPSQQIYDTDKITFCSQKTGYEPSAAGKGAPLVFTQSIV